MAEKVMRTEKIEFIIKNEESRASELAKISGVGELPKFLSEEELSPVREFHNSLEGYAKTPLVRLSALAKSLGLKEIYIKDESKRFGLNAFKGLGASYAVAKATEREVAKGRLAEDLVFVTATDGNHGRAVAWSAAKLGAKAFVFMPKGSALVRAEAIRSFGETVCEITDMDYDDTVRFATKFANERGYILVQDTGFAGYEEIPNYITQGYTTMAAEALEQMEGRVPTHTVLQAGVGSLAGGVLGYLANRFGGTPPVTTIVEPTCAACVFASAVAGVPTAAESQGQTVAEAQTPGQAGIKGEEPVSETAFGDMLTPAPTSAQSAHAAQVASEPTTQMAGLNCGEVNVFTWPILRDFATCYAKCPEWVTEIAIRQLAHPLGEDEKVVSGESGAVGLGFIIALCTMEEYREEKERLGLDENSVVLLFSTEGDTDPENYKRILLKQEI